MSDFHNVNLPSYIEIFAVAIANPKMFLTWLE